MNKHISGVLFSALILLSLTTGCGTVSQGLVESCTRNDTDLKSFNAVYWKPGTARNAGRLIVTYSVENPVYPKQEKRADSYWAEISIGGLAIDEHSRPHDGIRIHRRELSTGSLRGYKPLPILPIADVRKQAGNLYVWDYLGKTRTEQEPLVVVESNWMAIQDKSYTTGHGYRRFCPTRSYIPAEQYPKLVSLFPFAIIGDIVTFPLVLCAPRWN